MTVLYDYFNKKEANVIITQSIKNEYQEFNKQQELKFNIREIDKQDIDDLKKAIVVNEGACKLARGELSCIVLALNNSIDTIFTDDKLARKYIKKELNAEVSGTLGLLQIMYNDNYLTKNEVIKITKKMKKEGYWISSKVYSTFIKNL